MSKHTVERNRCDCHPETCACNPWRVVKGEERIATLYDHGGAEQLAQALNERDRYAGALDEIAVMRPGAGSSKLHKVVQIARLARMEKPE